MTAWANRSQPNDCQESWRDEAYCAGRGPGVTALFYSDDQRDRARARDTYCAHCPVAKQCREAGVRYAEFGVWGGMDLDKQWRRKRSKSRGLRKRTSRWQDLTL